MTWKFFGFAAAAALLAIAPAAQAQLSSRGGPIAYSADSLDYFGENRQLVLRGDVEVVQDDATLRAQELTLFFAPSQEGAQTVGAGDIERMEAVGEVFYIRPEQTARGDRATYLASSDTVTFNGNVVVASPENVVRGDTLVLEVGPGRTALRPAPGQRVQGAFAGRQSPQAGTPQP